MSLTLLKRESFQGVGTLNASTPGNLGTVATGSFPKRPVGPRLTADASAQSRGWSADLQRQGRAFFEPFATGSGLLPASGSNDRGMFVASYWIYLDDPPTDGSNGKYLIYLGDSRPVPFVQVRLTADGLTLAVSSTGTVTAGTATTLLRRTWYELRLAWQQVNGYWTYDAEVLVRAVGASTFVSVATVHYDYNVPPSRLSLGFSMPYDGNNTPVRGRLGMFSAYLLTAWSDRLVVDSNVIDPSAGPFAWYVNPATGNDNNDGTTPNTAWASAAKINTESAATGLFSRAGGYGGGDTLNVDLSGGSLFLGAQSLTVRTQGLNVVCSGAGELRAWDTLSAGAWSPVAGTTKVYSQVPPVPTSRSIVWENDKWPLFAVGGDLATVKSYLESAPGSCWCDAATGQVYLHPLGNTDPRSDGKTYTYSISRPDLTAAPGAPGIFVAAPDVHINGGDIAVRRLWKTALFDYSANSPYLSYGLQSNGAGGTCLFENLFVAYNGAHGFGYVDSDTTRQYTTRRCRSEQCCPPQQVGQVSNWVDYTGTAGDGTATSTYEDCVTQKNIGVAGSVVGAIELGQPVWLSHGEGGHPFSKFTFTRCDWRGGALQAYGDVLAVDVIDTTLPVGSDFGGAVVRIIVTPPTPIITTIQAWEISETLAFFDFYSSNPRADTKLPVEQICINLVALATTENTPLHLDLSGDPVAQSKAILADFAADPQPDRDVAIHRIYAQTQALQQIRGS